VQLVQELLVIFKVFVGFHLLQTLLDLFGRLFKYSPDALAAAKIVWLLCLLEILVLDQQTGDLLTGHDRRREKPSQCLFTLLVEHGGLERLHDDQVQVARILFLNVLIVGENSAQIWQQFLFSLFELDEDFPHLSLCFPEGVEHLAVSESLPRCQ